MHEENRKEAHPQESGEMGFVYFGGDSCFHSYHCGHPGLAPVFAHPEAEDIQCVTITQSATRETALVDASSEDLELTANLLGCLSYKPFSQGEGEPAYVLEYSLKDGRLLTVGVNETSVFYQGKSHLLKMEDFPFNAVEGVLLR